MPESLAKETAGAQAAPADWGLVGRLVENAPEDLFHGGSPGTRQVFPQ
jgi:hypothetical protein